MPSRIAINNVIGQLENTSHGSPPYLLNAIAPVVSRGAFSTSRKLLSTYNGKCIRVRRSSDNAESDIGFKGAMMDSVALTAFSQGYDCFLTTVYDQSGNNRNRTQAIAVRQPRIVASGVPETVNGRVVGKFYTPSMCLQADAGVVILPSATTCSVSFVYSNTQSGSSVLLMRGSNQYGYVATSGSSASPSGFMNLGTNYVNKVAKTLNTRGDVYNALYSPTNFITHFASSIVTDANWSDLVNFGGYGLFGGFEWYGFYAEEIYFDGDQTAIKDTVQNNQLKYYNIV